MVAPRQFLRRAAAAALLAAATAAAATRTPLSVEVERAARTVTAGDAGALVRVLAADDMDGRGLETAGNDRAAEYVADAFRRRGLAAAIPGSYFQHFPVYDATLGRASALEVRDAAGREVLRRPAGDQYYPAPSSAAADVTAPLTVDERRAAGRILLAALPPRGDRIAERRALDAWISKGAVGVVAIKPSLDPIDDVWTARDPDDDPAYQPADVAPVPIAYVARELADRLRPFAGRGTLTLRTDIQRRPVPSRNVVAAIEGTDPKRRGELVVVGAHLDHDGVDPVRGVFNGADDDASGVAGVLEVAEAFAAAAAAGARPARTVVFGIWNAEEKGMFGSRYFVAHPSPPGRSVANLNLDMIGRDEDVPDPSNPRFSGFAKTTARENVNVLHLLGYSFSPDLTAVVREANESAGFDLRTGYDAGSHNLLRRSDHWSFIEQDVPALFLTTGLHPDYHTPDDDVDKINFEKLARVARLAFEVAWRVADAPAPPRFVHPARP